MIESNLAPRLVLPGAATVYDQLQGEKLHFLLTGHHTGGAFALFIDEVPPNGGPPLHIHHREDETFYILEGELMIQVGEEQFAAPAGSSVFLPRGIPHTFTNVGAKTAHALVVLTPGGLEGFFAEVEPLVTQPEPDMPEILTIAAKYGIEAVRVPLAEQVKGRSTVADGMEIVRPEQARTLEFPEDELVRILLDGQQTNGQLALLQGRFPSGGGASLHCHLNEDEVIFVLDGVLSTQLGNQRETAAAGAAIFLPRNIPHDFRNDGQQMMEALALIVPAGLENYFADMHKLMSQGMLDEAAMMDLAHKYAVEPVQQTKHTNRTSENKRGAK